MSIVDIKRDTEQRMQRSFDALKNDLSKIRTGRAHTGLLDHILVEYYGAKKPISQAASLTLLDAHTIGVQPWEKSMARPIEKAIRESDLGLNPAVHGDLIRVPMPVLTEERRRDLTKIVRNEGEGAKITMRNLRRSANEQFKKLVKNKEISEDAERRAQEDIQEITDKFIAKIDQLVQTKQNEIMTV